MSVFFDADKVMQILEIPDQFVVVEMTPLGYPEKTLSTSEENFV
jgi:hypothetical protein